MNPIAECPSHGPIVFSRCEPCAWWFCPVADCESVITDESVTPDGADVTQWVTSLGHCGRSIYPSEVQS